MREVVLVDGVRTPIGRYKGALADIHPVDLGALTLGKLMERHPVAQEVGILTYGCMNMVGEQSLNVGRNAWIAAGLPVTVPAVTMDFQGGSGLQALNTAASLIASGEVDVAVTGGVESLSRVPLGAGVKFGDPIPESWRKRFDFVHQGYSAELVAEKYGYSRQELDRFAFESHKKAAAAISRGRFAQEIVPVMLADGTLFENDQCVRFQVDLEKMASLPTPFKENGVVTAANCSSLGDGSCALLLASREKAEALGLPVRAKILAQAAAGADPTLMLMGTVPATQKALQTAGLSIDEVDLFEVNESFASALLAWADELQVDMSKVNPNGGSIALGDPVGATGGRLVLTLLHELERRNLRIGLVTINCGGGLGVATVIERE